MGSTPDGRVLGLGGLSALTDDAVIRVISFLGPTDLLSCGRVSHAFYIFSNEDLLWREFVLNKYGGAFEFQLCWKVTYLTMTYPARAVEMLSRPKPHIEGFASVELYRRWYHSVVDLSNFAVDYGQVERRSCRELSLEKFIEDFDEPSVPVVLTDVLESWPARTCWTKEQLVSNYGELEWKISHKGDQEIKVNMRNFVRYADAQHDETPLYIFDSSFAEKAPQLRKDYEVPAYFVKDYLEALGDRRPRYRWFVQGPARSGSPWHVDPNGTSAWNALLAGRKRWALYPPGVVPPGVAFRANRKGRYKIQSPFPVEWFLGTYPLLTQEQRPLEFTQQPGELVYVPRGWWHAVINLDHTIAVTQNFVNDQNLDDCCQDLLDDDRLDDFKLLSDTIEASSPELKPRLVLHRQRARQIARNLRRKALGRAIDSNAAIAEVLARHSLAAAPDGTAVKADSGTNLAYLCGDLVVKLYPSLEAGAEDDAEASFQKEAELYSLLASMSSDADGPAACFPSMKAHGHVLVRPRSAAPGASAAGAAPSDSKSTASAPPELLERNPNQFYSAYHARNAERHLRLDPYSLTNNWNWAYLVTTRVPGESAGDSFGRMSDADAEAMATYLGHSLRKLHGTSVAGTRHFQPSWTAFCALMKKQREAVVHQHRQWHTLDADLIAQLEDYLPSAEQLQARLLALSPSVGPRLLHGDITDENVLGRFLPRDSMELVEVGAAALPAASGARAGTAAAPMDVPAAPSNSKPRKRRRPNPRKDPGVSGSAASNANNTSSGGGGGGAGSAGCWVPSGLIDLGDAIVGDPMYELVALFISALRCDKRLLRVFLRAYADDSAWTPPSEFARVAMWYTLLHVCDAMLSAYQCRPELEDIDDLHELEKELWDLSEA